MSLSIRGLGISLVGLGLILVSGQKAYAQTGAKRALAPKQVKLSVVDAVQVRTRLLPLAFDDKGAPRKLTTEEVKELRGTDAKLPGYAADYSDLKAGQAVLINLGRIKPTPPPKDGSPSGDEAAKGTAQSWDPAGQLTARLVKVEGPEFAKSKTTPKGKSAKKTIPRQITISVTANAVSALQDLSVVLVEILDDRTTK
jgi:hypothetical protein